MDVRIASYTLTCASGRGVQPLVESLDCRASALQRNDYADSTLDTWIGRVHGLEDHCLPPHLLHLDSRNNRLSDIALQQDGFSAAVAVVAGLVGPHRVGIVLGTSTSSVGKTESGYAVLDAQDQLPEKYEQPEVHNPHAPGHFIAERLGITGPSMTISTACSSSSKVFAAASRWLSCGLVDAVIVGGVDSLCLSILHGFASLELISPDRCRPFDSRRNGINIGEAAGFALLLPAAIARDAAGGGLNLDQTIALSGYGESSDAYHMAQPHPEGRGAILAMTEALNNGNLNPEQIGYVNLHGTATRANDLTETKALSAVFKPDTSVSSTKGWTGHTLGAAGITGSVIALNALKTGQLPGTLYLESPDDSLEFPIMQDNVHRQVDHVMVNSFGFGGSNCSLIFSQTKQ